MRKHIVEEQTPLQRANTVGEWLDLKEIASAELTSEDPEYPFESALEQSGNAGWRAATSGVQTVRLRFDQPQQIRRIRLRFVDPDHERQQEFVLRYRTGEAGQPAQAREIVRQQWAFSPGGSTEEIEDYSVNLQGVVEVELEINPDRGRDRLPATLSELMMA